MAGAGTRSRAARGVAAAMALLAVATAATACLRVPPPATGDERQATTESRLPELGAPVVPVALGPQEEAGGAAYLGQLCQVASIEANAEAPGFVRALLTCGDEQVLFAAVRLHEITKLATQRRLPAGLAVKIAGIGPGDVYFASRERFVGGRCLVVALRRSQALYYQGTLKCAGVPYQFAYVALAASP